jgi:hypothetical protein
MSVNSEADAEAYLSSLPTTWYRIMESSQKDAGRIVCASAMCVLLLVLLLASRGAGGGVVGNNHPVPLPDNGGVKIPWRVNATLLAVTL